MWFLRQGRDPNSRRLIEQTMEALGADKQLVYPAWFLFLALNAAYSADFIQREKLLKVMLEVAILDKILPIPC
jgi:hypothetical protein